MKAYILNADGYYDFNDDIAVWRKFKKMKIGFPYIDFI